MRTLLPFHTKRPILAATFKGVTGAEDNWDDLVFFDPQDVIAVEQNDGYTLVRMPWSNHLTFWHSALDVNMALSDVIKQEERQKSRG